MQKTIPAYVTAGRTEASASANRARWRAQRIARRIADAWPHYATDAPASLAHRLERLCVAYDYPGPFVETVATLARQLRRCRGDLRHVYGQGIIPCRNPRKE